jgi:hypothetical protein
LGRSRQCGCNPRPHDLCTRAASASGRRRVRACTRTEDGCAFWAHPDKER